MAFAALCALLKMKDASEGDLSVDGSLGPEQIVGRGGDKGLRDKEFGEVAERHPLILLFKHEPSSS